MSFLIDWIQTGCLNINSGPEIFQQERGMDSMRQKRRVAQLLKSHIGPFWQVLKWRETNSCINVGSFQSLLKDLKAWRNENKKSIVRRISKARQIYLKLFFLPLQYASLTFKYLQLFIETTLPYLSLKDVPSPFDLASEKTL